jgi:filamentous hemagglutinin family protein
MIAKSWFGRCWQWQIGACIAIFGALSIGVSDRVNAQIVPDDTLGTEGSVVTPNLNIGGISSDRIEGGATRGANLFHSFSNFNVGEGKGAYFANPTGIENILTRVTGSNASNIFGRLGVLGGANLFLLNPNGIVFGPNASLDIQGSFVATTATRIQLGDSGYFSAAQPQTSRLLSVSPGSLFFDAVANQPGSIMNRGNLSTGKHLALSAGNLDLQGQLEAGGDLTLQAQDTVKVRDSAAIPFIASAGGNLLVQGNHRVDIFALNHPESGLFSGGNMVLRSSNTVGGDAHYWSGGSFRIEQLDGSLGNLFSPHDPIIRATGDVFINAYQGASLHILAGGKVEIPGYVWIQGADPENGLVETVNLADGTTVSINGKSEPTLDIRAGVNPDVIGGSILTLTGTGNFIQPAYGTSIPSSADIKIGTILFTLPDNTSVPLVGRVLLTNQYQPNSSLSGDIQVTDTQQGRWGAIFMSGGAGNPSVVINSRGSITLDGTVNTSSSSDDGGAIALTAGGNLTATSLNSSSSLGNGGAVAIDVSGDITTTENRNFVLNSSSESGNGGAITFSANNITGSGAFELNSSSESGNGGAITLSANNITVPSVFNLSSSSESGNGGAITLSANGNIATGAGSFLLNSSSESGNGSAITLSAHEIISIGYGDFLLNSSSESGNGSAITLSTNVITTLGYYELNSSSESGNGGAITLSANEIVAGGDLWLYSNSDSGNGGAITLSANEGIITTKVASLGLYSYSREGNGGAITLSANELVADGDFLLKSNSDLGNGGAITLSANGNITAEDGVFELDASSDEGNGGSIRLESLSGEISIKGSIIDSQISGGRTSGTLQIEAESVTLTNTNLKTTAPFEANAGAVFLNGKNSVSLNNSRLSTALEPGATGRGGDVTIEGAKISLSNFTIDTATYGNGDAGNVSLLASDSISLTSSAIFSITDSSGNAGKVTVNSGGTLSLTQSSTISTAVDKRGTGDGGDIEISTGSLSLTGGSQLQALTRGTGDSGNIKLNLSDALTLSGIGPDGFLSAVLTSSEEANSGQGGNIEISTSGTVSVTDGAVLSAQTRSHNDGGNITVNANQLELSNGGQLLTNTFSSGRAGNITVNARERVSLTGADSNFDERVTPQPLLRDEVPIDSFVPLNPYQFTFVEEQEPNNSIPQSQPIDDLFSINSIDKNNSDVEFSTRIPYVSIADLSDFDSDAGQASLDYYSFNVTTAGTRVIVDIDDTRLVDTVIALFDEQGNLLASNNNASGSLFALAGLGSKDSYLTHVFSDPGTYFIAVGAYKRTDNISGAADLAPIPSSANYTLQVSLDSPRVSTSIINTNNLASGLFARSEGAGAAGNVTVNTPQLTVLDGGNISATAMETATSTSRGGNIEVNASQVNLQGNNSGIFAQTEGAAPAGSLTLQPSNNGQSLTVNLQDNAQISASTSGSGQGGSLSINAPQAVTISGNGQLSVETSGAGVGGNLTIETQRLTIQDGAQVSASTSSPNSSGKGGSIIINATEFFNLSNQASLLAQSTGAAQAGNVIIKTEQLTANNGSITTSATATSLGEGGSIDVNASQINLSGTEIGLLAETQGVAPAGSLTLQPFENAQSLSINLQDNAKISAATSGSGEGGSLSVKAPSAITIRGQGQLSVETTGDGAAGDLRIDTQRLTIADGATISASTSSKNPEGVGGNLTINATQSFNLTNVARLLAESTGAAPAGNITIDTGKLTANNGSIETSATQSAGGGITITASDIRLFGDSDIRTDVASGAGGGGNINITANSIIAFDDSDILAYAADGKGGDITFKTPIFFGFAYSPAPKGTDPDTLDHNNQVDINATGAVEGVISLPNLSFIQNSLTELPDNQIDTDSLLANSCIVRRNQPTQGSFTITGTGGLPQRPGDAQMSTFPTVDIETLPSDSTPTNTNPNRPWQKGDPIVEPQGVYRLPNGKLVMSRECSRIQ